MRDALGPGTTLGYCTNVHAGATLDAVRANLERYALAVKRRVSRDAPMGVGLWLPAAAARELRAGGGAQAFRDWLAGRGLDAFTLNGFPYGDFHRDVVKHDVYRPNWTDDARVGYTDDLVHLATSLAPPGGEISISTLPIGWRGDVSTHAALAKAAGNLRRVARGLARKEAIGGPLVHIDLEPEPGCVLERSVDVVKFFEEHLLGGDDDAIVRRHLRVCHDVCHAAVMFEPQAEALRRYADAGIAVGKVQLSSALRISFPRMSPDDRRAARDELAAFGEDRYLHQTTVRDATTGAITMHDDLPAALAAAPEAPEDEWRVHYHVPLFLERAGHLETTAAGVAEVVNLLRGTGTRHFEVETYAWDVLPRGLRATDLADGIAREIEWVVKASVLP